MTEGTDELLSSLSLTEKASLLAGADMWHTVPLPHRGIPAMKVSDGPNGVRGVGGEYGRPSASFPVGIAMGATWNMTLIEQIGVALAEESHSKRAHVLLGPTVNIHRSPLAGRNFECFAEDPFLSGKTAAAYIRGVQSRGVGACIKHFVCNDQEFQRYWISAEVAERPLHEIYLEPFRIALAESHPWTLMSAYNRINGVYASESDPLLRDVLKRRWGFDGLVISDWYGTYSSRVPAGGLDLEMPGAARWMHPDTIVAAVEAGELDEAVIDDKVRRLLRTMERVGLFDNPNTGPEEGIDQPHHRALARRTAAEAIVLLKNENSLLPLNGEPLRSIAVIGQNARRMQAMGGGSSAVWPHYVVSPLDGIGARAGEGVDVRYALGCAIDRAVPPINSAWLEHGHVTVAYFTNTTLAGEPVHVQHTGQTSLSWFGDSAPYVDLNHFSLRMTGVLRVPATDTYTFTLGSDGLSRLTLDGELKLDLWDQRPAEKPYAEPAEKQLTLTLEANRPYPFEVTFAAVKPMRNRFVHFGCLLPRSDEPIQEAVDLAAQSDVAIIVAGLTSEWEAEGFDRPDLHLVGEQDALISRVAAANPNTIVVLNAGSPIAMPWLADVPAVLQLWYPGQEGGNALADVLFGDVSPSGRLPTTFPQRLADNPAHINFPGENDQVHYGEGIFVGYRYYDQKEIAPLFPFGYGLSYTTYRYDNLNIAPSPEAVVVSLDVTNVGARAGQEVVQLYLRDDAAAVARPPQELKAFEKVALEPGETRTVRLTLTPQSLAYYDSTRHAWITEPGSFTVRVGSSSRHIHLEGTFEWPAAYAMLPTLHTGLDLDVLLADSRARTVLATHLGEARLAHLQQMLAPGMSLRTFAGAMPDMLTPPLVHAIDSDLAALDA